MFKKLIALFLAMPLLGQNVHSEPEKNDTTSAKSGTKIKDENIDNIDKKIERKEFLEKELSKIPSRISNCKDSDELEELTKTLADYQNELIVIQDEETKAGISFKQRRYEAKAVKEKDVYSIQGLIEILKEKQKEFLGRQKLAQNRLLNANKNTRPEDKAMFRENLNNVNLGITNLETKIKKLEQTVAQLKAEELMGLKERQKDLQEQLDKLRDNFPKRGDDESDKDHIKNMQKWVENTSKVGEELKRVNEELAKIENQNNTVPSE